MGEGGGGLLAEGQARRHGGGFGAQPHRAGFFAGLAKGLYPLDDGADAGDFGGGFRGGFRGLLGRGFGRWWGGRLAGQMQPGRAQTAQQFAGGCRQIAPRRQLHPRGGRQRGHQIAPLLLA